MVTKDGTDDIAKQTINIGSQNPYPIQAKAATAMSHPISVVSYKECQRNHAASMGAVVMDGCGEFMPVPMPMPCTEQQQHQLSHDLKCAVCGCHRNFHRKHVEMHYQEQVPVLQCVVPPPVVVRGAFGTDVQDSSSEETELVALDQPKKRFRTKFSAEQKAKMFDFAEHMGWRVQRSDDSMVRQFCAQVGVKRRVFKVWIHNQKQAMKKKQQS